jgi:hypothetical protein
LKRHLLLLALLLVSFAGCGKGGGMGDGSGGTTTPSVHLVNNRALLSWSASSGMPDGYYVDQSTDGTNWTQIQNVTETSTYVDGLTSGTKYYFRVRSYNSAGTSAASGTASLSI